MAPNLLLGGLSPGGENMGDIVIPELKEKIEKLQVMVGYEVRFIFIFPYIIYNLNLNVEMGQFWRIKYQSFAEQIVYCKSVKHFCAREATSRNCFVYPSLFNVCIFLNTYVCKP